MSHEIKYKQVSSRFVMQDAKIEAALMIEQGLEVISVDGLKVVGVCHHCGMAVTEDESGTGDAKEFPDTDGVEVEAAKEDIN